MALPQWQKQQTIGKTIGEVAIEKWLTFTLLFYEWGFLTSLRNFMNYTSINLYMLKIDNHRISLTASHWNFVI